MRRSLFLVVLILLALGQVFAIDQTSIVTIESIVRSIEQSNPNIVVGIGSTEVSEYLTKDDEKAIITGLDLEKDGSYSFVLVTSDEVFRSYSETSSIEIEIQADGFHLYEDLNIKHENVVNLINSRPEIIIPIFSGNDQNVLVSHVGSSTNKVAIQFLPGLTKSNLILGAFSVQWNGKSPLDAGLYKAKVSVIYSAT